LVDEINVPYMLNGDVQPGGEWLAYTTTYQVENPVDGTTPLTGSLLNLNTGQRLRITQPGEGSVGNWSPDGNWFLSSNRTLGLSLVSADGHEWVRIPDLFAPINAAWSPDSKYLAYALLQGESPDGHMVTSWTGSVHVVNVPAREVTNLAPDSNKPVSVVGGGEGSTLLMQPKWSRDSKTITFLSGGCSIYDGSKLNPAIVNMAVKK
jgi:Tol biopolymer transport system component